MYVVVVYDVNESRIPEVNACLSRYLHHVMLSGFEGEASERELTEMYERLRKIIDPSTDSVRIYVFESKRCVEIIKMGKKYTEGRVI